MAINTNESKQRENRQRNLQAAARIAREAKEQAIKDANAPLGICSLIFVMILLVTIAGPAAGVIAFIL